jgi:hypothetical protein
LSTTGFTVRTIDESRRLLGRQPTDQTARKPVARAGRRPRASTLMQTSLALTGVIVEMRRAAARAAIRRDRL